MRRSLVLCRYLIPGLIFFFVRLGAHWLVLANKPLRADICVVLGGGGGSRLRKAISVYNNGFADTLLLVGFKAENWNYITGHLCPDCTLDNKNVVVLNGSSNTMTDAELTLHYCLEQDIKTVLVITDPYHTRRASLIFMRIFQVSRMRVQVVSSGDYGKLFPPDADWWKDHTTRKTVWLEYIKSLFFFFMAG
ncbi:MAG: hypothetical protein D3923_04725 [Candidatus Electrothrix sp. AR3]|nr:hypothetical protein [Candidatus Electrothrix sp. AR3]